MISDADFDDVFPWMARKAKKTSDEPARLAVRAPEFCVARWEDDDGRASVEPNDPPSEIRVSVPSQASTNLDAESRKASGEVARAA